MFVICIHGHTLGIPIDLILCTQQDIDLDFVYMRSLGHVCECCADKGEGISRTIISALMCECVYDKEKQMFSLNAFERIPFFFRLLFVLQYSQKKEEKKKSAYMLWTKSMTFFFHRNEEAQNVGEQIWLLSSID